MEKLIRADRLLSLPAHRAGLDFIWQKSPLKAAKKS